MSDKIRFRMEGDLCVLQVLEYKSSPYSSDKWEWRDAKATDLIHIGEWLEAQRHTERTDRAEPPPFDMSGYQQ